MEKANIQASLNKLQQLISQEHPMSLIDMDVLLDHTRMLYTLLLDMKAHMLTNMEGSTSPVNKTVDITNRSENAPASIVLEMPPAPTTAEYSIAEELISDMPTTEEPESIAAPATEAVPIVPLPSMPAKDVRKYIGINDKYLYLNELFHNDKFDYEAVLDYINDNKSAPSVLQWLDDNYIQAGKWKKDDAMVQDFLQLVQRFYNN